MRLGRVQFAMSYVVDLDDPDMVERAEEALYQAIWDMGRDRDIDRHLDIVPADPSDTADDIPDILRDTDEEA